MYLIWRFAEYFVGQWREKDTTVHVVDSIFNFSITGPFCVNKNIHSWQLRDNPKRLKEQ